MAKDKKKPSKNARIAAKLLKDSNLSPLLKTTDESNSTHNVKIDAFSPKPGTANKLRPEKKRG